MYEIQLMCASQELTLKRETKKVAPALEKWGIEAESETYKIGGALIDTNSAKIERPKIGLEVPYNIMEFLK